MERNQRCLLMGEHSYELVNICRPSRIVEPALRVGRQAMLEAMMRIEYRVHLSIRRIDDRVRRDHLFIQGRAHVENTGLALIMPVGSVEEANASNRSHPDAGNSYRHTRVVSPEAMRHDGATTTEPHGTRSTWLVTA